MTDVAVIGACFGDEGKGHIVDYLAYEHDASYVVRFCGGAQAGHTVRGGGFRHVFHHFGSGTWAGAKTYFGRRFIMNPIVFREERAALLRKGIGESLLRCAGDERCLVTTHADMILNEIVETHRGADRHGSCGMGINETVERSGSFPLTSLDLLSGEDDLRRKLTSIVRDWVPHRLGELGIDPAEHAQRIEWIESERVMDSWIRDAGITASSLTLASPDFLDSHVVVYEGSQGLLLSEDNEAMFPHLTRASTGSKNIVEMVEDGAPTPDELYYVTRAYMTRHGAGPFPTEDPWMSYEDETNQPNPWQGTLRFGALDVPLIYEAIDSDVERWRERVSPEYKLAVTCCDQRWDFDGDAEDDRESQEIAHQKVAARLDFRQDETLQSWGPARKDVIFPSF